MNHPRNPDPQFLTDPTVAEKVSNAICISGIARSGTTIMGQLFHSLKNVEYCFEPAALMNLFLLMEQIPEAAWRILYQTCLYDDILVNAIAGRNLNFNSHDDSYIFGAKSLSDVARRFGGGNRYKDLFEKTADLHIAYKLPDIVAMLPALKERYPQTRMLVMLRSPDAVVLSLKRKGWFRREKPRYCESGLLKMFDGHTVPAIIRESNVPRWMTMCETDRCYLFYHQIYAELLKVNDILVVDYGRFIDAPVDVFAKILGRFGLEYGEKTQGILEGIAEPHTDYPVPPDADSNCRTEAWNLYHECKERSL